VDDLILITQRPRSMRGPQLRRSP